MRFLRYGGMILMTLALCTCGVFADVRPPNTHETQQIATFTSVLNVGLVTESDSLVWRQSNEVLDANENYFVNTPEFVGEGGNFNYEGDPGGDLDPSLFVPAVPPGSGMWNVPYPDLPVFFEGYLPSPEPPLNMNEVQMVSSMRENTIADQGVISYTKQSTIDTDWKPANMFNVEQQKLVNFIGSDTGRIVSEESALLDAAGKAVTTVGRSLATCPFANSKMDECVPAFCNIVEIGSSINMKEVQFSTDFESRTIAQLAIDTGTPMEEGATVQIPLPVLDGPPAELNYGIRVTGIGGITPAIGSADAYVRSRILEGNDLCPSCAGLGIDISYNEKTNARGYVELFQKDIHYDSGIHYTDCGA